VRQKLLIGIYISILAVFIFICVLSVFEISKSNSLSKEIKNFKNSSSQSDQIKKLQSELEDEKASNSRLSSQLNTLESNYNNLESQMAKIQETRVTLKSKVAYLTFDDGPSSLTAHVLDTLKLNKVHATFFVIGLNAVKYPQIIKRAYNENNVIGIHSWTHKYSYIYSSEKNFFADFNELNAYLTDLLGVQPTVCRYPGGTNNTVSQKYSDHIMRKIDPEVKAMGFKPYDWDSYAGDAEPGPKPTKAQVIHNVMKNALKYKYPVILFHDTSVNSVDITALPEIIKELRSKGYAFGTLSAYSPSVQYTAY
jgi:peptidoglycan/xylan/chitin deacetylase (PgdA/CDA1 family)